MTDEPRIVPIAKAKATSSAEIFWYGLLMFGGMIAIGALAGWLLR